MALHTVLRHIEHGLVHLRATPKDREAELFDFAKQGDTLHVVEHTLLQQRDSVMLFEELEFQLRVKQFVRV